MGRIELTEAEQWQVRAMAADIEGLQLRLALARELETQALTGMVQQHVGPTTVVYKTSGCGGFLEPVE